MLWRTAECRSRNRASLRPSLRLGSRLTAPLNLSFSSDCGIAAITNSVECALPGTQRQIAVSGISIHFKMIRQDHTGKLVDLDHSSGMLS